MDEFSSESGQSIELPLGIPKFKCNIPAGCPPSLLKRRLQRGDASLRLRVTLDVRQEYPYSPHPVEPLRPCRKRPRNNRSPKCRDEQAPLHVSPPNVPRAIPQNYSSWIHTDMANGHRRIGCLPINVRSGPDSDIAS